MIRQFKYNEKGQLLGEISGIQEVEYIISSDQNGSRIATYSKSEIQEIKEEKESFLSRFEIKTEEEREEEKNEKQFKEATEYIQYDASFRPVKQVDESGQNIEWDYNDTEYNKMVISQPDGSNYIVKQSKDGRKVLYSLPDGIDYEENYNEAGQLLALNRNNVPLYHQEWNQGYLTSTEYENSSMKYEYDENGIFKRILITPPGENETWETWMEYKYDDAGNLTGISDFTGMTSQYNYNENGEISSVISNHDKIDIKRSKGLVREIKTSWGEQIKYNYASDESLLDIRTSTSEGTSFLKFVDGQITNISMSNGSRYRISYYPEPRNYLVKQIQTKENKLEYFYNDNNQLVSVKCNDIYQISYTYDDSGRIKKIEISSR